MTPYMGNSGAKVVIRDGVAYKTGPGCAAQGWYANTLGPAVCPKVMYVQTHEDPDQEAYAMEALFPATPARGLLSEVRALLEREVWCRRMPRNPGDPQPWREEMTRWVGEQGHAWLEVGLSRLYPVGETAWELVPPRYVHGDPTLANAMRRADGRLALIDPLPPGGKVPGLVEVDLGKLLQSAVGWEVALGAPEWRDGAKDVYEEVLLGLDAWTRDRAWWWCAVHCARIVPYARIHNPGLELWAMEKSRQVVKMVSL